MALKEVRWRTLEYNREKQGTKRAVKKGMSAREEEIIPKQNMYFPDENIFHFVSYFKNKVNKRY